MEQVTLIFGAPSDLTVLFGFSRVNLVMALIDALRIVISENHGKGMEKLKEAILSWARKKKISSEECKKLRTLYINDHRPSLRMQGTVQGEILLYHKVQVSPTLLLRGRGWPWTNSRTITRKVKVSLGVTLLPKNGYNTNWEKCKKHKRMP